MAARTRTRGPEHAIHIGEKEVPSRDAMQERSSVREETEAVQRQIRHVGVQPRRDLIIHEDPSGRSICCVMNATRMGASR
jgi:hypothetical protein